MDKDKNRHQLSLIVFEEIVTYFFHFENMLESNCENFNWRRICKFVCERTRTQYTLGDIVKTWNYIKWEAITKCPYLPSISKDIMPWKYFDLLADHLLADTSSKGKNDFLYKLMRIYFEKRFRHQRSIKQRWEEDLLIISGIKNQTTQVKDGAILKSGIDASTVWSNIAAGFHRNFGYRPSKELLQVKFRRLLTDIMTKLKKSDNPIQLNKVELMLIDTIPEIKNNCKKLNLPSCDNKCVSIAFGNSVSNLAVSAFIDLTNQCEFLPEIDQKSDQSDSKTSNSNKLETVSKTSPKTLNKPFIKNSTAIISKLSGKVTLCETISHFSDNDNVSTPKIPETGQVVTNDTNNCKMDCDIENIEPNVTSADRHVDDSDLDSLMQSIHGPEDSIAAEETKLQNPYSVSPKKRSATVDDSDLDSLMQTIHGPEDSIAAEETKLLNPYSVSPKKRSATVDEINSTDIDIPIMDFSLQLKNEENIATSSGLCCTKEEDSRSIIDNDSICQDLADNVDRKMVILNSETTTVEDLHEEKSAADSNKFITVGIIDLTEIDSVENSNDSKDLPEERNVTLPLVGKKADIQKTLTVSPSKQSDMLNDSNHNDVDKPETKSVDTNHFNGCNDSVKEHSALYSDISSEEEIYDSPIVFQNLAGNIDEKQTNLNVEISPENPVGSVRNAADLTELKIIDVSDEEDFNSKDLPDCSDSFKKDSIVAIPSVAVENVHNSDNFISAEETSHKKSETVVLSEPIAAVDNSNLKDVCISDHSNDCIKGENVTSSVVHSGEKRADSLIAIDDNVVCQSSSCDIVGIQTNISPEYSPAKPLARGRNTADSKIYTTVAFIDISNDADDIKSNIVSGENCKTGIPLDAGSNRVGPGVDSAPKLNNRIYTIDISEDSNDGTGCISVLESGTLISDVLDISDDSNDEIRFDSYPKVEHVFSCVSIDVSSPVNVDFEANAESECMIILSQTDAPGKLPDSISNTEIGAGINSISAGSIPEVTADLSTTVCENEPLKKAIDGEMDCYGTVVSSTVVKTPAFDNDTINKKIIVSCMSGAIGCVNMQPKIDSVNELDADKARTGVADVSSDNTLKLIPISEVNVSTSESAVTDKTVKCGVDPNVFNENIIINHETANRLEEIAEKTKEPLSPDSPIVDESNESIEKTDQISNGSLSLADSTSACLVSNIKMSNRSEPFVESDFNKKNDLNPTIESTVSSTSSSCNDLISEDSNMTSETCTVSELTEETLCIKQASNISNLVKEKDTLNKTTPSLELPDACIISMKSTDKSVNVSTIVNQTLNDSISQKLKNSATVCMSSNLTLGSKPSSDSIPWVQIFNFPDSTDNDDADKTDLGKTARKIDAVFEASNIFKYCQIPDDSGNLSTQKKESVADSSVINKACKNSDHITLKESSTSFDERNSCSSELASTDYDESAQDSNTSVKLENDTTLIKDIGQILNDFIASEETTTTAISIPIASRLITVNVVSDKAAKAITVTTPKCATYAGKGPVIDDSTAIAYFKSVVANAKMEKSVAIEDIPKKPLLNATNTTTSSISIAHKESVITKDIPKLPSSEDISRDINVDDKTSAYVSNEQIKANFINGKPHLSSEKDNHDEISLPEQNFIIESSIVANEIDSLEDTAVASISPGTLTIVNDTPNECESDGTSLEPTPNIYRSETVLCKKSVVKYDSKVASHTNGIDKNLGDGITSTINVESSLISEEIVTMGADALRDRQIEHLTVGMHALDKHDALTENDISMLMLQWCMMMPLIRNSNGKSLFKMCPKSKSPWYRLQNKFESIGLSFTEEDLKERWRKMIAHTKENLRRFPDATAQLTELSEIDWTIMQNFPKLLKDVTDNKLLRKHEKTGDLLNTENCEEAKSLKSMEVKILIKNEEKVTVDSKIDNTVKTGNISQAKELIENKEGESIKDDKTEKTGMIPNEEIRQDEKQIGQQVETEKKTIESEDAAKKLPENVTVALNPIIDETVMPPNRTLLAESPSIFDLPDQDIESSFYEFLENSQDNTEEGDLSLSGYRSPSFQSVENEFIDISEFQVPAEDRRHKKTAEKFQYFINQNSRSLRPSVISHSNISKPVSGLNRSRFTSWPVTAAATFTRPPPPYVSCASVPLEIPTPIFPSVNDLSHHNTLTKRVSVCADLYPNAKRPRIDSDLRSLPPPYFHLGNSVGAARTNETVTAAPFENNIRYDNVYAFCRPPIGDNCVVIGDRGPLLPQYPSPVERQAVRYQNASFHGENTNFGHSIISKTNNSKCVSPLSPALVIDTSSAGQNRHDFRFSFNGLDSKGNGDGGQRNLQLADSENNYNRRLNTDQLCGTFNIPTTVVEIDPYNANLHKGKPNYVSARNNQEPEVVLPPPCSSTRVAADRVNSSNKPYNILQNNENVRRDVDVNQISNNSTPLYIPKILPKSNEKPRKKSSNSVPLVDVNSVKDNHNGTANEKGGLHGEYAPSTWGAINVFTEDNIPAYSISKNANADPIKKNTNVIEQNPRITDKTCYDGTRQYLIVIENRNGAGNTDVGTEEHISNGGKLSCDSRMAVIDKNNVQPVDVITSKFNPGHSGFIKGNVNISRNAVPQRGNENALRIINPECSVINRENSDSGAELDNLALSKNNATGIKNIDPVDKVSNDISNPSNRMNSRYANIIKENSKISPQFLNLKPKYIYPSHLDANAKASNSTGKCDSRYVKINNNAGSVISKHASSPCTGSMGQKTNSNGDSVPVSLEMKNNLQYSKSGGAKKSGGNILNDPKPGGITSKRIQSVDSGLVEQNQQAENFKIKLSLVSGRPAPFYRVAVNNDENNREKTLPVSKAIDKLDEIEGCTRSNPKSFSVKSKRRGSTFLDLFGEDGVNNSVPVNPEVKKKCVT